MSTTKYKTGRNLFILRVCSYLHSWFLETNLANDFEF